MLSRRTESVRGDVWERGNVQVVRGKGCYDGDTRWIDGDGGQNGTRQDKRAAGKEKVGSR